MELKPFLHRIKKEFPEISFKRATLPRQGMDHLALFLDNKWVFRFPINRDYKTFFPDEIDLLNALHKQISLPIPYYECVSKDKSFGGYKKISGKPITHTGFKRMSPKTKQVVAVELGTFLNELHSFPVRKARSLGVPLEDPSSYLANLKKEYPRYVRPKITAEERQYSEEILALSETYAKENHQHVMIHNDMNTAHILLTKNHHIAGIIDFSDKAIGDPAKEFSAFWDIDPLFVHAVYEQYKKKDLTLLSRSLLLRKRGSLSWLAYNSKSGTPQSYARAYRQFRRIMKLEIN